MFARALLSCLLAALAAMAPAQACPSCSGNGQFECKLHPKGLLEKERAVKFCSDAAACKSCGGALQVDCRSCRNDTAEKAIAARQALVKEWLAKCKAQVEAFTKNPETHYLQTEHLDLCFSIKPLTIGKEKVETHPLMHLYAQRIETMRQNFLELFECKDNALSARLQIFMFRDQADHALIGPRVTSIGSSGSSGVKLMGKEAVYSMWMDPRYMTDDESVYRTLVHNLTHLLMSNLEPAIWIGNRKHGWVDEGLAHWFEDRITGKCTTFCFEEVLMMPGASFKGGRWRTPVRKLVDASRNKSFAELSILNTDQLSFEDHAVAFAYVDFLLSKYGGAKFRDLLRLLKQDKPTRDALQQVYSLTMLGIDAVFVEWVRATYPPVEKDK